MATTTFCDIKFTENVDGYNFERKQYSFDKGDVVALPRNTANNFVNKWGMAEYASTPYEIRDEEYDDVVCKVRDGSNVETCEVEKSDGEVCGREKPCPYHGDEE